MFISSLLYTILCIWVFPPITITQLANFPAYGIKKNYVGWNEISNSVKLAALASEDQTFLEHHGIDWEAIEKSMQPNPKRKSKRPLGAGASTISQQVAKNVFLWQGSGWSRYLRKIPEFYFTLLIECCWSKQRILEVYLNVIEMGKGIYGIQAASQQYFSCKANQLSEAQAAQIIACLPNPKKFTVVPQSHRVSWRYKQVIREMNNLRSEKSIQQFLKKS